MLGLFAIATGVCGTVWSIGYLIIISSNRYSSAIEGRLRNFSAAETTLAPTPLARKNDWTARVIQGLFGRSAEQCAGDMRFIHAGFYSSTAIATFLACRLSLVALPALAGVVVVWLQLAPVHTTLLMACSASGLGLILPSLWLDTRVRRRHCILRRSLADFLDLVIVCLESGLSMPGTVQRVTEELRIAHPLLGEELRIVERDLELGTSISTAFRRFAERSGYTGIRTLSTLVRESQRFGTELIEALRVHAETLRTQREQVAEEGAQKAAVKILIPTLLLILPAVFVVLAGPAWIQIQAAFSKN
jgi:tight adherence protein C